MRGLPPTSILMAALTAARAVCASSVGTLEMSATSARCGFEAKLGTLGRNVQMSSCARRIFPVLVTSTHRWGCGLGAAGTGGVGGSTLGGSGGRESIFIVGFIVMCGAMLVLGACVVAIGASWTSRFDQNFLINHQITPRTALRTAMPKPSNIHCLFWTIQSHIVG